MKEQIEECTKEEACEKKVEKVSFFRRLIASIVDQYICFGFGIIIIYLLDVTLKLFGYRISEKILMLIIVYGIFNVLYMAIASASKWKKTFGKALLRIY